MSAWCAGGIARHRDVVVGVKARLSADVAGPNDIEGCAAPRRPRPPSACR